MSSYLNIYGIPREDQSKRILIISFSRSQDIYSFFEDSFMNADKEIELSLHKLDEVKAEIRADLTRQEKRLALYKECHKTMEEMEEIISISEFIDTLKDTSNTVDFLTLLVSDAYYKFSGIEKYVFKIE